jgi:hypothetical protein
LIKLQELRAAAKNRGYGYVCRPCDFEKEPCPEPVAPTPVPTPGGGPDPDPGTSATSFSALVGAIAVHVLLDAI